MVVLPQRRDATDRAEPLIQCPTTSEVTRRRFLAYISLSVLAAATTPVAGCGGSGGSSSNTGGSGTATSPATPLEDADTEPSGTNDAGPIPAAFGPLVDDPGDHIVTVSGDTTSDGRAFAPFPKSDHIYEPDKFGKLWIQTDFATVSARTLADGRVVLFSEAPVEAPDGATSLRIGYRLAGGGWRKAVLAPGDMEALHPMTKSVLTPMQRKGDSPSRGLLKWAKRFWDKIVGTVKNVLTGAVDSVGRAVEKVVMTLVDKVAGVTKDFLSKWLDTAGATVVGTILAIVSKNAYVTQTPLTMASLYKPALAETATGAGAAQALALAVRVYAV